MCKTSHNVYYWPQFTWLNAIHGNEQGQGQPVEQKQVFHLRNLRVLHSHTKAHKQDRISITRRILALSRLTYQKTVSGALILTRPLLQAVLIAHSHLANYVRVLLNQKFLQLRAWQPAFFVLVNRITFNYKSSLQGIFFAHNINRRLIGERWLMLTRTAAIKKPASQGGRDAFLHFGGWMGLAK